MSDFTERDLKDIEQIESNDNAVLLKEIKALRAEVKELKGGVVKEKSRDEKIADIMAIKSRSERLRAINENMSLFEERDAERRERAEEEEFRRLGGRR